MGRWCCCWGWVLWPFCPLDFKFFHLHWFCSSVLAWDQIFLFCSDVVISRFMYTFSQPFTLRRSFPDWKSFCFWYLLASVAAIFLDLPADFFSTHCTFLTWMLGSIKYSFYHMIYYFLISLEMHYAVSVIFGFIFVWIVSFLDIWNYDIALFEFSFSRLSNFSVDKVL